MINVNKITDREERMVGMFFIVFLFLPHTPTYFQIVNPILITYLIIKYANINSQFKLKYFLVLVFLLSFFYNSIFQNISTTSMLRVLTLSEMLLFFPFVRNIKIRNTYLYFALLFILFSQLSYHFNISFLINFIDKYYPVDEEYYWLQSDFLIRYSSETSLFSTVRNGGIFRNANQCMRYVSLIVSIFVIENINKSRFVSFIPFFLIAFVTALFAGSRTGFVVLLLIIVITYSITTRKYSSMYFGFFTIFLGLLVSISVIDFDSIGSFRLFKITEGLNDSFATKTEVFFDYLNKIPNIMIALIGNFDERLLIRYNPTFPIMDSEYGNLIFNYGFLFFILLVFFYVQVFRRMEKSSRLVFIIFLWMLTSTVFLSYRMSFLFMFFISKYTYSNYKSNGIHKDILRGG